MDFVEIEMMTIDWTIQLNEENGVGNGTVPVREEIEFDQRYAEEKKTRWPAVDINCRKGTGKKRKDVPGQKVVGELS